MTKITNTFIGHHFGWDYESQVKWSMVQQSVLSARHVLANADKFPRADFDSLEKMDQEGSVFLLRGPVQYLV